MANEMDERMAERFAGRAGVHAIMWRRGSRIGYSPVRAPLNANRISAHRAGNITVGTYVVRSDQNCGFFCIDLDLDAKYRADLLQGGPAAEQAWARVQNATVHLGHVLRDLGLDPVLEASGFKGCHVWVFFREPLPAKHVRAWCHNLFAATGPMTAGVSIEIFPKQDTVDPDTLGNLVKLPLGVHARTGRWSTVLDATGTPVEDGLNHLLDASATWTLPELPTSLPPFDDAQEGAASTAPVPVRSEPDFTEADLSTDPQLRALLTGCPVLGDIVRSVIVEESLSRDAAVVLEHSLGHRAEGVRAYNYLLSRISDTEDLSRLGSPHRGSPVSCRRIRQRLAGVAERVGCNCALIPNPGGYRHPLLHLRNVPEKAEADPADNLEGLLKNVAVGRKRLARLNLEQEAMELEAIDRLEDNTFTTAEGKWLVESHGDAPPVLCYVRAGQ